MFQIELHTLHHTLFTLFWLHQLGLVAAASVALLRRQHMQLPSCRSILGKVDIPAKLSPLCMRALRCMAHWTLHCCHAAMSIGEEGAKWLRRGPLPGGRCTGRGADARCCTGDCNAGASGDGEPHAISPRSMCDKARSREDAGDPTGSSARRANASVCTMGLGARCGGDVPSAADNRPGGGLARSMMACNSSLARIMSLCAVASARLHATATVRDMQRRLAQQGGAGQGCAAATPTSAALTVHSPIGALKGR